MKFETARIQFLGIWVTFFAAKLPIIKQAPHLLAVI